MTLLKVDSLELQKQVIFLREALEELRDRFVIAGDTSSERYTAVDSALEDAEELLEVVEKEVIEVAKMESLIIRLSPRIKEIQRLMPEILMHDYGEMYNNIVTAHEKCQEQAEGDQGHDDEGDDDEGDDDEGDDDEGDDDEGDDDEGDDDKGDDDERDGDEGDEEKATN